MRRAFVVALALAAAGCGSGQPRWEGQLEVTPGRGTLTAGGRPLAGAHLMLHPTDPSQKVKAQATTGPAGEFAVTTYKTGDGGVPGEYVVTVAPNPDPGTPDPRFAAPGDATKAAADARARIPAKYADPKTSPLRVKIDKAAPDLGALELK